MACIGRYNGIAAYGVLVLKKNCKDSGPNAHGSVAIHSPSFPWLFGVECGEFCSLLDKKICYGCRATWVPNAISLAVITAIREVRKEVFWTRVRGLGRSDNISVRPIVQM